MSRAFTPPDTLTPDDVRTVADVRRAVWINGLLGLGVGSVSGMFGHLILQSFQRRALDAAPSSPASSSAGNKIYQLLRQMPPLGRNTFFLSFLGGGALGSFVMSTTAGKNSVHLLHPIFAIGKEEHPGKSPYQKALIKAQQPDSNTTGKNAHDPNHQNLSDADTDELDAVHHRARSLRRAQSVKQRLEHGHSLSDSHGNSWAYSAPVSPLPSESEQMQQEEKDKALHRMEAWERRQSKRRVWVQERIERGRALSDSTGGHWSKDDTTEKKEQHK